MSGLFSSIQLLINNLSWPRDNSICASSNLPRASWHLHSGGIPGALESLLSTSHAPKRVLGATARLPFELWGQCIRRDYWATWNGSYQRGLDTGISMTCGRHWIERRPKVSPICVPRRLEDWSLIGTL